jgi:hypothetical protein
MAQSTKKSSGSVLKQADLLRKLEYAWVGSGALASVAGTVVAMVVFSGFMGTASPTPGMDDLGPGRVGLEGNERPGGGATAVPVSRSSTVFMPGDWIETFDTKEGRNRVGAVVETRGDQIWVRFCDRVSLRDDGLDEIRPAEQLRKWDVKSDPRAQRYVNVPLRAQLSMGAEDFKPGEEVTVHFRTASDGRARVIGVDGTKVAVRWNDTRMNDESIPADSLRLVTWGPFDRLDPVPASLVPKSISKPASAEYVVYTVGQKVEVIFRGEWVAADVAAVTGPDTYLVLNRLAINGSMTVKGGQIRAVAGAPVYAGSGGGTGGFTGERSRAISMTSMPSAYYKPEDEAEALFGTKWEPVKVKRVEGMKIYIYPRETDGAEEWRSSGQLRVTRELMQKRMDERMTAMRSGSGMIPPQMSPPQMSPPPAESAPSSSPGRNSGRGDALTALDCRPGMAVTVREPGRVSASGRVSRVEGDQVYVVLSNSGGTEVARTVDQLSTTRADSGKMAAEYRAGERVYVRWGDSNAWWTNRVEKIEGDRIILKWGQVSDSSEVLRTRTAEDVRPMKMLDERNAR